MEYIMEEGGITVVYVPPVQLAACFSDKSVTEAESNSNNRYYWGETGVLLGAVEMAGATALCAPEPTGLTKARMCGCGCT